jgi:NTE family protein
VAGAGSIAVVRAGTAFVLGGGGLLGAVQVGMLRALFDAGVRPELVVGTSVGAVNGVVLAAAPPDEVTDRLEALWRSPEARAVFRAGPLQRLREITRTGTAAHSPEPLRRLIHAQVGDARLEDLPVPFQCCAAAIEDAAEHWFDRGGAVDAVLASCAVPGLLPPVRVGDRHYLDGGLVHSIPLGRAVELGARRVFVLQVGRVEQPLRPPRRPWEVAAVAFEIARRHRFAHDLSTAPPGVEVHVLPAGDGAAPRWDSRAALRYRDASAVGRRIDGARAATAAYLQEEL